VSNVSAEVIPQLGNIDIMFKAIVVIAIIAFIALIIYALYNTIGGN